MAIEIQWESNGYHKCYRGHITGADIADSVVQQVQDPRFTQVRYAINEYEPGMTIAVSDDEITRLEHIEQQFGYRDRGILITYVTQEPALIRFLSSVYLESPMMIYSTVHEARAAVSRVLKETPSCRADTDVDAALYLGEDGLI